MTGSLHSLPASVEDHFRFVRNSEVGPRVAHVTSSASGGSSFVGTRTASASWSSQRLRSRAIQLLEVIGRRALEDHGMLRDAYGGDLFPTGMDVSTCNGYIGARGVLPLSQLVQNRRITHREPISPDMSALAEVIFVVPVKSGDFGKFARSRDAPTRTWSKPDFAGTSSGRPRLEHFQAGLAFDSSLGCEGPVQPKQGNGG